MNAANDAAANDAAATRAGDAPALAFGLSFPRAL